MAADGLLRLRDRVCVACPATGHGGCERDSVAVDFISLFPAELLLHVTLCLSPADVTRCLLVCCAWCARLSQLEPYWQVACRLTGLSGSMMKKFGPRYKTWRELFLGAQNYLRRLSAPPSTTVSLTPSCPYDVRCSYQYARQGCMIGTVYRNFKPREIVVDAVRGGRWRRLHTLELPFESRPENRVVWGHLLRGGVYVCVTASGRWSMYTTHPATTIATPPPSPLSTWVGDPLYDTDLRLGCCERCGLVAIAKLVSFHSLDDRSYWDLRLLQLSLDHTSTQSHPPTQSYTPTHSRVSRFKMYHRNRDIVGRRVAYGKKGVCLVSKAPPTTEGACSDHLVLLQWANTVTGSVLSKERETAVLSQTSHMDYTIPCGDIDTALTDTGGLNAEMVLSADRQLLGLVFQARLHVWDLWSRQDVSCVDLPPHVHEPFEQLRLLAVGHLLTVVGQEFSTCLLVVVTQTGRVVTRCERFAQQHSRMVPPYTDLLCVNEEAWLSDITTSCTTDRCVVVYWNKTNRSLEAILLGEGPVAPDNSPPTRVSGKKHWWKLWK